MLARVDYLDLATLVPDTTTAVTDEMEQEITSLLRAKAPEMSSRNSFRIASSLIDTAVSTIVSLQAQVAALEEERNKLSAQEAEWESLLLKWRDVTAGLKNQLRDAESRLSEANQRVIRAEQRAQSAEDDAISSQRGSFDICDKVIAAFGSGTLAGNMGLSVREVEGSC